MKTLSFEELRFDLAKRVWGYDDLSDSEKRALLNKKEHANFPQPVDYGLTRNDLYQKSDWHLVASRDARNELRYKEEERRGWFERFIAGFSKTPPNPALLLFKETLRLHCLYEIAVEEAAREKQKLKRSYWTVLDGYAFENATAGVLNKHQFNARVTRGSGDGGIDIEVTRNGLRGVVQCKAHVACIGPSVVRDLYGVIHHSRADFGIVVSRGGFSRGAADFARDKPIYFLDTDHLIAMQEGKDVLAEAFKS